MVRLAILGMLAVTAFPTIALAATEPPLPAGLRDAEIRPTVVPVVPGGGSVQEAALHPAEPRTPERPDLAARWAMRPKLIARVDVSDQTMRVIVEGEVLHTWKVSTAGKGYRTPRGVWQPYRMHTMWRSRKYDDAPMPHSIFFTGGYAIHATPYVRRLGRPASHGCVRLAPENAKELFRLARQYGASRMRVIVEN